MARNALNDILRTLPSVDALIRSPQGATLAVRFSEWAVKEGARKLVERHRCQILEGRAADGVITEGELEREVATVYAPSLRRLINATGVVIHTNLGRSPLAKKVLDNIVDTACSYSTLEYDLKLRRRGKRPTHIVRYLQALTGAEGALVVNNNAAAVFLSLKTLAEGRDVVVSRGELVEIGGSFRIPDIMRASAASLVEVGATNRTHLKDYRAAITENTALLLKVHRSNYDIVGFTAEVSLKELVELGRERKIPVMVDLGSGSLLELSKYGLSGEPTVSQVLASGADLVTFSGDKLLGGTQAGLLVGRGDLIDSIAAHPLHRAVRVDKLTLAGLEAVLRIYLMEEEETICATLPTLRMLTETNDAISIRAKKIGEAIKQGISPGSLMIDIEEDISRPGGGSLPLVQLPTTVVKVMHPELSADKLAEALAHNEPPVVARVADQALLLDLRTVDEQDLKALAQAIIALSDKRGEK